MGVFSREKDSLAIKIGGQPLSPLGAMGSARRSGPSLGPGLTVGDPRARRFICRFPLEIQVFLAF